MHYLEPAYTTQMAKITWTMFPVPLPDLYFDLFSYPAHVAPIVSSTGGIV